MISYSRIIFSKYVKRLAIFGTSFLPLYLICTVDVSAYSTTRESMHRDTISPESIRKIIWNDIKHKYAVDGAVIAKFRNGDSVIVARKDLEDFARERSLRNPEISENLFTKMEIEPQFPGGEAAWNDYMSKNMQYPKVAMDNKIQGTVVLHFIVDQDGNVIEPIAISGPTTGGLREEALRLLKLSGKWLPAIQNILVVKAITKHRVEFKLPQSE